MIQIEKKKGGALPADKVSKDDTVTVYGTGKSKFFPKDKAREVHPIRAKKLIESGKAKSKK